MAIEANILGKLGSDKIFVYPLALGLRVFNHCFAMGITGEKSHGNLMFGYARLLIIWLEDWVVLILPCLSKETVDQSAERGASQLGVLFREFDAAPVSPASCSYTLFFGGFHAVFSFCRGFYTALPLSLSLALFIYIMSPSLSLSFSLSLPVGGFMLPLSLSLSL